MKSTCYHCGHKGLAPYARLNDKEFCSRQCMEKYQQNQEYRDRYKKLDEKK